jgi:hypothetical protein
MSSAGAEASEPISVSEMAGRIAVSYRMVGSHLGIPSQCDLLARRREP